MKKLRWGGLLALLVCLLLLCACDGNPLPQGMEEETLLDQGREIVQLLNEGDYDAIYDQMRQDGQETTSVEDIQSYFQAVLDEAGARLPGHGPEAGLRRGVRHGRALLQA